jgi:hypothetical protein
MEPKRSDDVVLASGQLEIEMDAELGLLLDEEAKRVVEGRGVRPDVSEPVRDEERAVAACDHVELHEVDTYGDRRAERRQRVLASEGGRAAVPDAKRPADAAFERDHGDGLVGR